MAPPSALPARAQGSEVGLSARGLHKWCACVTHPPSQHARLYTPTPHGAEAALQYGYNTQCPNYKASFSPGGKFMSLMRRMVRFCRWPFQRL